MARYPYFLIIFLGAAQLSCKKSDIEANFHGRVTYACDASPVKGLKVYVKWVGLHEEYTIQEARTDGNGYYSFISKVSRPESLDEYRLVTTGEIDPKPYYFIEGGWSQSLRTNDDAEDIRIDIAIPSDAFFNLHVKNANPYDANDVLHYVKNVSESGNLLGPLYGSTIDTTIVRRIDPIEMLMLEYKFTKNDVETIVNDSLLNFCNDTVYAEIFY